MDKGGRTRGAILDEGVALAFRVGLGGLTIGSLASQTGMSKSGLFAHFRSKEALQLGVLGRARATFTDLIVRPALGAARGEPRARELFEHWLACSRDGVAGACLFVKAATEFDDQPGRVRDQLAGGHRDLLDTVAQVCRTGVTDGQFSPGTDTDQFAHDLYGLMLIYYLTHRLLGDPAAEARTRASFEALLDSIRA